MFKLFLAAIGIFTIITIAELIWRGKKHGPEFIRKFIHATVGSFVAFWPWFLSWEQIELSAIVFVLAITATSLVKPLGQIFTVASSPDKLDRSSAGEFFFTLGFAVAAFGTHNKYIFMAALLHLSVADTLAAVIGKRYGRRNRYSILGLEKSFAGSLAFLICSIIIVSIYCALAHADWSILFWLPLLITALENVGVYGSDNLSIPLSVTLLLRLAA